MQLASSSSGLALQRVAAHNHNLVQDGEIVGSLVRVRGNAERSLCWRLDVDAERITSEAVGLLDKPIREFGSFAAAAYWLGIL